MIALTLLARVRLSPLHYATEVDLVLNRSSLALILVMILHSSVVPTLFASPSANAVTVTITPSDDGSIHACDGCNPPHRIYVVVVGETYGALKFPTSEIHGRVTYATLSVNPYGLPLHSRTMDVYAFESDNGIISNSDAHRGTLLGTWALPPNLGYGEDTFFDVTNYLKNVTTPYVGFTLRSPASHANVFSSRLHNLGHPSQLTVTTIPVPEPGAFSLVALFFCSVIARCMRRRRHPENEVAVV